MADPPAALTALAAVLPDVPTIKYVVAGRGNRYNGAWWDRFAGEIMAALLALPASERDALAAALYPEAAAERERLTDALEQAELDLLAYGHHLEGEIVYRGADWQAHRLPGETCRCGLDAAIARVHAALAPAAPVQEDSHE